jgi:flagellar biosynthesis/type III secretory pathway chaperone
MTTPSPTHTRKHIVEVLGESVLHAMGLLETLQQERTALETQDDTALLDAVDAKSRCVNELRELENRRRTICESIGFTSGPFQMEELAAWCDEDSAIKNCWDKLMEIAAECNAQNLTNGSVIRIRQNHIEANLAVIRGKADEQNTYQRHGSNHHAMMQRSIAEA